MASLPGSPHLLRALVAVGCALPLVGACGRSDPEDYLFGSDGTIGVAATSGVGTGANGTGANGTGANGTGANGTGANGTGANGTGANGTGANGTGTAGKASAGGGGTRAVGGSGPITEGGEPSAGGADVGGTAGTSAGGGTAGTSVGGVGIGGVNAAGSPAGGQPAIVPISCGADTCDANTEVCCAGVTFGCLPKGQTCNGAVFNCTSNADCAGRQVCCVSLTGDVADASSCKATCNVRGTGRDRQLCDVDADCGPPFRFCTPTIFGINICTRRP